MIQKTFDRAALVVCIISLLVLGACSSLPQLSAPAPTADAINQAVAYAAQGNYDKALALYQQAATNSPEPRRSWLFLRAADVAAQSGATDLARQLYGKVDLAQLNTKARQRFIHAHPAIAGSWLASAIQQLVQRSAMLLRLNKIKANNQQIWATLEHNQALLPQAHSDNPVVQGWIALAMLNHHDWPSQRARSNALLQWQLQHLHHPAMRFIVPQLNGTLAGSGRPGAGPIGLALPLSGRFSGAAAAIAGGFLTAYYDSGRNQRPQLYIYNTTKLDSVTKLLHQATADGVTLLVGPLRKQFVTALQQTPNRRLTVLALNYVDTLSPTPGFYQFGLSPEGEARAAAQRAIALGFTRAVAIVPQGSWGSRILSAFRSALLAKGGQLLNYATFDPQQDNHGDLIQRLLPRRQHAKPPHTTGPDFIFLAARPVQARLLSTQLRYYHAGQLPVFATASVFSGTLDPRHDRDLDGLRFPVMSWFFDNNSAISHNRQQVQQLWPAATKRYPRLFAMGFDAWTLARQLHGAGLQPGRLFPGNTGVLSLLANGQIQHDLRWAQFQQGRPVALAPPTPPAMTASPADGAAGIIYGDH